MQRLREQESDIEFKMLDSGGDEEEHLAAQDLCSLLRAGRIRGWRHLPTLAGRDAKLFGPKAGYKQCAAALADHALGVWPKIAQDIQKPFEARLPKSRYTMLALASWFDSAEKGEQTMVLARSIRSAFKKESTGTALMRLIGLLVRDPNTYDDEGRTVWSQPTKNLVEGERQPMTKDEALEMADSVLVDAEVVDALVELSAERPRVLSAVNDEFRAEGYTLEYAAMHKELEKERVDVTVAMCKAFGITDRQLDEVCPQIMARMAQIVRFPGDRIFSDGDTRRRRFQEYKNGWDYVDLSERTGDDRPHKALHAGVGVPLERILSYVLSNKVWLSLLCPELRGQELVLEIVVTFDARKRKRSQQCLGAINFMNARYLIASTKMGWRTYLCQGKDDAEEQGTAGDWFWTEFHRWNGTLIPHPLDKDIFLQIKMTPSLDMACANNYGCFNSPTSGISLYYSSARLEVWRACARMHVPMDYDIELAIAVQLLLGAQNVREGAVGASQSREAINRRMLAFANDNGGCRGYPHHGIDAQDIPMGVCFSDLYSCAPLV
jgi:hypothetical protein